MSQAGRAAAASPGARRVLELARRRGRGGVHSSDLDVPGQTADGGPPIRRLAARVDELRNLGHRFETRRRPDRTVEYFLVRDAGDAGYDELLAELAELPDDRAFDDVDERPRLFDPPAPAPLNALRDWEDAA